jgi:hypothetical protein
LRKRAERDGSPRRTKWRTALHGPVPANFDESAVVVDAGL